MFAYNPTLQIIVFNIFIIAFLAGIGVMTQNPLVILGLLLLPQVPIVQPSEEEEEQEEMFPHDSGDSNMGFTAKLRS